MEIIRKVVNGADLVDIIDIPDSFVNKKLEVLVFPFEENKQKRKNKKDLAGILAEYANKDLIEKEKDIWYKEAKEE